MKQFDIHDEKNRFSVCVGEKEALTLDVDLESAQEIAQVLRNLGCSDVYIMESETDRGWRV